MAGWEDCVEDGEPLAHRLQFARRVISDGTAAGRSLLTIMLDQSGVSTKDEDAAACAQIEGCSR
ncbi:hypothetical protein LY78DRAFT_656925 [Colletotrichum sublineola]|nr:hypothetical protein LY78DRAFT_656925 [Colletotrichum sublineola]